MEDINLTFVLEALGYNTECMDINKHVELRFKIERDTFLTKTHKRLEGVGSLFEGIVFISDFGDVPDMDYVRNYTELEVHSSWRPIVGCDIVNVENVLKVAPCSNFPGYVYVMLGQHRLPNAFIHAANHEPDWLTEDCYIKANNGPAYSKYLMYNGEIVSKTDVVNCYAYKSWPDEANKWVSRKKPNNWPSKELIEKIKSKGFNLAPIGHTDCYENYEQEFQHRIGIRGERELLAALNETQILCYVALRLILKADIKLIDEHVLSSFHIKNVVFWCAEQESCQWTKENFQICLKTCINKLTEFITRGQFPHYFIEDRNLLNSKMTPNLKRTIVSALTKYSRDVLAILNLSSFDRLKKKTCYFKTTLLKREKERSIIHRCISFYWETFTIFKKDPHMLWENFEGHNTANNLQNAKHMLSFLEKTNRNFILKHISYVKSMLGLLYYSRYHETRCKHIELKLNAVEFLSTVTFENISLKCRVVNFYFLENEFEKCLDVCNDFLSKPRKYKTLQDKNQHTRYLLKTIKSVIDEYDMNDLTELKEKMCAFFHDDCMSDNCGNCRIPQDKTLLSNYRFFKSTILLCGERGLDALKVISDLYYKTLPDIILMTLQDLPNLCFCHMSFNVPYLASEKWAVPDVIQYELLSVQRFHPESSIYGIYIDPMLNCLVLSFLCCQKTNYLTKMDEMLTKMDKYVKEYPPYVQPVAAELPHSLQLFKVYNIVAYCFVKAGRYQHALNYIMNSLELNENTENVACGYTRCISLYVKEYIK